MGLGVVFLNIIHTVNFLIGAVVLALAITVLVTAGGAFPSSGETNVNVTWMGWVPLAVGIILVIGSILGCCFTKPGNCCFLSTYGIIQFICGALILICGSMMIASVDVWLKTINNTPFISQDLPPGVGGIIPNISDYMQGLFIGCCSNNTRLPDVNPTPLHSCHDESNPPKPEFPGREVCFLQKNIYDTGVTSGAAAQTQYCTWPELEVACKADLATEFIRVNYEWAEANVLPVGIALTVFGSLIFLASICSCAVGCQKAEPEKEATPPASGGAAETGNAGSTAAAADVAGTGNQQPQPDQNIQKS